MTRVCCRYSGQLGPWVVQFLQEGPFLYLRMVQYVQYPFAWVSTWLWINIAMDSYGYQILKESSCSYPLLYIVMFIGGIGFWPVATWFTTAPAGDEPQAWIVVFLPFVADMWRWDLESCP